MSLVPAEDRGDGFSGAGVKHSSELLDVGAGTQFQSFSTHIRTRGSNSSDKNLYYTWL